jgi:hypothetical protein
LKQWNDQFTARRLDPLVSEMRFYRGLIFIRVDKKKSALMISPMVELSHKLGVTLEVYVDLA